MVNAVVKISESARRRNIEILQFDGALDIRVFAVSADIDH